MPAQLLDGAHFIVVNSEIVIQDHLSFPRRPTFLKRWRCVRRPQSAWSSPQRQMWPRRSVASFIATSVVGWSQLMKVTVVATFHLRQRVLYLPGGPILSGSHL